MRLALAPWCAIAILKDDYRLALAIFFIAGWTDFFDGWVARRFNWNSKFGAVLDPLADKALMTIVYAALWLANAIPPWLAPLVFGRDLIILLGVAVIAKSTGIRSFPPTIYGKISTLFQILAAGSVLLNRSGWSPLWLTTTMIWAAAVGTTFSGADYVRIGWRMIRGQESR